jgi:hypothetical protein
VTEARAPLELTGSCLCGTIQYWASGLGPIGHCHCDTCRRAHSAAFSTVARVARSTFRWTRGESSLASYQSSPGKHRYFCSHCGSQLAAAWEDEDEIILRLGCLDTDPETKAVAHVWTSDEAPWYDITDDLPQVPRGRQRTR